MSFGRGFAIAAAVLGLVTVVLGVVCVVLVGQTRGFLAESSLAGGEVIGLESRQSCEERDDRERECSTVYAPTVRFETADGREIVFTSGTAASPPDYAEGDEVEVRYRTQNPQDARIDSLSGIWIGSLVTGGIAVVFGVMCGIFVFLAVRFRTF